MEVRRDTEPLLSFNLLHLDGGQESVVKITYASTDRTTKIVLWDNLYDIASHMNSPWLVGGDFSVITNDIKKFGGSPVQFAEIEDFRRFIAD